MKLAIFLLSFALLLASVVSSDEATMNLRATEHEDEEKLLLQDLGHRRRQLKMRSFEFRSGEKSGGKDKGGKGGKGGKDKGGKGGKDKGGKTTAKAAIKAAEKATKAAEKAAKEAHKEAAKAKLGGSEKAAEDAGKVAKAAAKTAEKAAKEALKEADKAKGGKDKGAEKAAKAAGEAAKAAAKEAKSAAKEAKSAAKEALKEAGKAKGGKGGKDKGGKGGKGGKGAEKRTIADDAGSRGDPHFVMFSGGKFDFHGGCDLVLVQNPEYNNGQGLYIHIRTKIVRWWSYIESVVVQIGSDTLEVKGGVENKQYWVNGQPGEKLDVGGRLPFQIGGHDVRYRHLNDKQFQLKIFLEDDQNIVLKSVKDMMRVDIEQPKAESFGASVGLMGSFEGGNKFARDGVTEIEDPNEFGKEWQVQSTEPMLFHAVEGVQHPQTCEMPTMSVTDEKRRLEGSITREQAAKACRKVAIDEMEDCVFDVMATNDVDMAGAY